MVMTVPAGELRSIPRHAPLDGLRAAWNRYLARRAHRVALRHAAHLGPRLLADMGIDPATARSVSDGWSELMLNGLLHAPRR